MYPLLTTAADEYKEREIMRIGLFGKIEMEYQQLSETR
jgi:hypothetical protein